ncbi:FUSC family protein [Roseivivax sp. THAF30]|uniref:FUSC family protein n=1 Tax=Roseivivax sp. THAF30 TaxID=2587852 RepID=UPI0012681154|nr:FUSC family protein [Roseivivax sp. THAF30]QFT62212.1 hypothetical protein FIU91_04660 [Roseivivax sp. THAF30]
MLDRARAFVVDGDAPMPWKDVAGTLCAVALPVILAISVLGQTGAAAFVAALPAHLAAKHSGTHTALAVTLVTGLGGVLALGSHPLSLMVAGVLSAICALGFRHGLSTPCLRALMTWCVFTGPILPADDKPLVLAVYLLAMSWSLLVTWAFGQSAETPQDRESSPEYSLLFGIALGLGLVISVDLGARLFGDHGFWFPLTFVILWIPPFGKLFSRTAKRTAGTIAGVVLAIIVTLAVEGMAWKLAIILAILPLAFRILPLSYAGFTALLTLIILEALSIVSDVSALAVERLASMFAAALLAVALGAASLAIVRRIKPEALDDLMEPDG